jgi:hypothetical protein
MGSGGLIAGSFSLPLLILRTKHLTLLACFEVVGDSYHLANLNYERFPPNNTPAMISGYDANNLEFRCTGIRFRLDYIRQANNFIWVCIHAGYIYAY